MFKTYSLSNSAVLRIYSDRDVIDMSPEYQRQGEIWTDEKRQLLIDSILNDFDIPKLYFHVLDSWQKSSRDKKYQFAVVDGRQRLEAIFKFIDGKFALSADFQYYADKNVKAGNMTYAVMSEKYPKLKMRLDSFVLPIICIETDDLDLIEDMFLRLNEAVPLNAAEKRNAIGGHMAKTIRDVANHPFFKTKARFGNARYQHREVSARLLFIEFSQKVAGRIIDTKKSYLDTFVRDFKTGKKRAAENLGGDVVQILNQMCSVFVDKDELLQTQSIVPIYYLVFKQAINDSNASQIRREHFLKFREELRDNKRIASEDISKANYDFLEFDKLSVQGTNDSTSIKERLRILSEYLASQVR